MRLRNKPWANQFVSEHKLADANLDPFLAQKKEQFLAYPKTQKWALEIGCGKGDFIIGCSIKKPDMNYIAIEKISLVMAITYKKIEALELKNMHLLVLDATKLGDVIPNHFLDKLYLNFSDPWPKKRHAKRRLTSPQFLQKYYDMLKDKGEIIMKTDSVALFDYSLQTLKENKFVIKECTYDYQFDEENDSMSEYERKFREKGIRINRLIAVKGE